MRYSEGWWLEGKGVPSGSGLQWLRAQFHHKGIGGTVKEVFSAAVRSSHWPRLKRKEAAWVSR